MNSLVVQRALSSWSWTNSQSSESSRRRCSRRGSWRCSRSASVMRRVPLLASLAASRAEPVDRVAVVDLRRRRHRAASAAPAGDDARRRSARGRRRCPSEALRRIAERVDQPVVPGALAVDVADEAQPARRDGVVPLSSVAGSSAWSAGKSVPSIAASHTSLVKTRCASTSAIEESSPSQRSTVLARASGLGGTPRPAGPWRDLEQVAGVVEVVPDELFGQGVHRLLRGVHPQRHGRMEVDPVLRRQPVAVGRADARRVAERPGEGAAEALDRPVPRRQRGVGHATSPAGSATPPARASPVGASRPVPRRRCGRAAG